MAATYTVRMRWNSDYVEWDIPYNFSFDDALKFRTLMRDNYDENAQLIRIGGEEVIE